MHKVGSVIRIFFATACLLDLVCLPGCGDNVARTAPEAVVKAKKEDIDKAEFDALRQAKAAGKKAATPKAH